MLNAAQLSVFTDLPWIDVEDFGGVCTCHRHKTTSVQLAAHLQTQPRTNK